MYYISILQFIEDHKALKYIILYYFANLILFHIIAPATGVPDLVQFYDGQFVANLYKNYSSDDLLRYQIILTLDSISMIGLSLINSLIFKKLGLGKLIIFIPLLIFPFDLAENIIAFILTFSQIEYLFQILSITSALKWTCIFLTLAIYPLNIRKM